MMLLLGVWLGRIDVHVFRINRKGFEGLTRLFDKLDCPVC
jgi:hypothetical protein